MSDPQEHFGVTTSTGNGAYDQICAFSQTIINKGFEELHNVSKDLQQIYQLNTDVGKIDATLKPCQVIIPGADEGLKVMNVIFLLRFADGKLYNKQGDIVIPSMKDFTLAYKVDLELVESTLNGWEADIAKYEAKLKTEKDPIKLASTRGYLNATKKKKEYFINTYKVPGDYSFKRLFLKLSSTRWSNYEGLSKYSSAGFRADGEPYPMNEWLIDMNTGPSATSPGQILADFLAAWGKKVENQEMSCLGVSFKPPKVANVDSTLRATSLIHQTSPYKVKNSVNQYTGETGFTEIGSRNCLLYCEMVDNHPQPAAPIVTWTGNFATRPSRPGATDQVDGSFLLGRAVFFEKVILKHLSRLNQATAIFHEKVEPAYHKPDYKVLTYSYPLSYGGNPDHKNSGDPYYAFETNNPTYKNDIQTKYVWDKGQIWPTSNGATEFDRTGVTLNDISGYSHCKQWFEDKMHSEVTWVPGQPELKVSGTTTMTDDAIYDQGLTPANFADNNLTAYSRFTIVITWNLTLKIVPSWSKEKQSFLTLVVDSGVNHDANVKVVPTRKEVKNMEPGQRSDLIESYVKTTMTALVKAIVIDLEDAISKAGKFIYPAGGVLKFSDPAFTRHGDFLATVTHEPLTDGIQAVVPTAIADKTLKDAVIKKVDGVITPKPETLRLDWSIDSAEFFENQPGQVTFTCKNTTEYELNFQSIIISVKAGTEDATKNNLFAVDVFVADTPVKRNPAPANPPAPKSAVSPAKDPINPVVDPLPKSGAKSAVADPSEIVPDEKPTADPESGPSEVVPDERTTIDPVSDPSKVVPDGKTTVKSSSKATTDPEVSPKDSTDVEDVEKTSPEDITQPEEEKTDEVKPATEQPPAPKKEVIVPVVKEKDVKDPSISGTNAPAPKPKPAPEGKEEPGAFEKLKRKIFGAPPPKKGTIKIEQSTADLGVELVIRNPKEASAEENVVGSRVIHSREWQAVIQSKRSTFFTVKKDEWIKITFRGIASSKSEQTAYIDEIWANEKGETDGHRIEPRVIAITSEDDF